MRVAGQAVAGLTETPGSIPSATFVSATVTDTTVTLCWLGDSRAYWLGTRPESASQQLTTDDSLAQEMVRAGLLEQDEALESPHAHVVTRWIGSSPAETAPHLATFDPGTPGVLLLCSDGLWNYQPEADELAALALPDALTDPLGASKTLVDFAIKAGGRDNITVVLIPFPPAAHRSGRLTPRLTRRPASRAAARKGRPAGPGPPRGPRNPPGSGPGCRWSRPTR